MERTISLAPSELKLAGEKRLKGFDAVYIGSEFCENKLPAPADYRALAVIYSGPVVTVTPPLSGRGLAAAEKLAKKLSSGKKPFEMVVNDWGLLRLLKKKFRLARPVLGRLIIWEIARMSKSFLNDFCRDHGIEAVEADCEQVLRELKGYKGRVNYHAPLRFRSVTRYCPYTRAFNSSPCARLCGAPEKLSNTRVLGENLYMIGNAYFTPNRPSKNRMIARTVEAFMRAPLPK